ncbi:MAG: CRISPR-associated helicase/endonuclease Cas3, partial [Candidatus Electrothrix sp. AR3]|nr:CRISPR-associated helicase/endonuclease Cas3 [Candidatus Electrothrix sp. AR3]
RMDKDDILDTCQAGQQNGEFAFTEIAKFRMIENANQAIIIALEDEALKLVNQLKCVEFPGPILRCLQQYSVQVYPNQFKELEGWLEKPCPGLDVYVLENEELYSKKTGLECQPPEGQGFIL